MTTVYFPCLKLKANEIGAIQNIEPSLLCKITPFFDIPKNIKEGDSEESALKYVNNAIKKMDKWWNKKKPFAIDCYDIPTIKDQSGFNIYKNILQVLSDYDYNIIPVIALNRDASHNIAVKHIHASKKYEEIILRLDIDDISDYSSCRDDIEDLFSYFNQSKFTIFLDIRLIKTNEHLRQVQKICKEFIFDFNLDHNKRNDKIVISSSSIPAYIAKPKDRIKIERFEKDLYFHLKTEEPRIIFSDYGIIGPDYTDNLIPDYLMQEVSTPKLIYTCHDIFHVFKGGSFRRHERGYNQFHDLAAEVCNLDCYRKSGYRGRSKFCVSQSQVNMSV